MKFYNNTKEYSDIPNEWLTYDDVMLMPQSSSIDSRNNPSLSLRSKITPNVSLDYPIVAANMDTVCGPKMYQTMLEMGAAGILHRNVPLESLTLSPPLDIIFLSLTLSDSSIRKVTEAFEFGYNIVVACIDIAHGHMHKALEFVRVLKNLYGESIQIISGSVANHKEIGSLVEAGVDTIRVGVGGGSMCFVPNTQVFCGHQVGYKNIRDVRIGDSVLSHKSQFREVINTWESHFAGKMVKITFDNQYFICTPTHKIFVNGEEIPAKKIKPGDFLQTGYGEKVSVTNVEKIEFDGLVYDLEVETDHSYCITHDLIAVHNCTTRIVTGHGVPNFTNICLMRKEIDDNNYPVNLMADGGIRSSGDIVKALAAGADTVMIGSLFAATEEAPGEIINQNGELYKKYRGQASRDFMKDNNKTSVTPEGESVILPYKGSVVPILQDLLGGIRSGLTYSGAYDIKDLRKKAEFIKISHNGFIESTPHGLSRLH